MSIVLAILKVIGTILLAVLCIVAALIVLFLFAPFRYSLRITKEEEPFAVRARLTWLFRVIQIDASYRDGEPDLKVKLLWFTPGKGREHGHRGPTREERGNGFHRRDEKRAGERIPDRLPEEKVPEQGAQARHDRSGASQGARKTSGEAGTGPEEILEQWLEWVSSLPEKILDLLSGIRDAVDGGADRMEAFFSRVRERYDKLRPWLSENARSAYGRFFRRLMNMLRHFRPGKMSGYLRFGTGEPDQTALLYGFFERILPASAQTLDLQPALYEAVFATDMEMRGHIRLNHVAALAVRQMADSDFRKILKRFVHRKR